MTTKISSKVVSNDGLTIFERTSGNTFSMGYNHSPPSFRIAKGNSLGTEDILTIDATGKLTLGSAPKTTSDTNTAGLDTIFTGGSGTGNGTGGSIKFNVACPGGGATEVNAADDTVMTISAGASAATSTVTIAGNLTVNGTTTTIDSTTVTIEDPIFTLGGDSAPSSDDNKDRGIEFRYHDGTSAKLGFFGYDDSASKFTFIANATNTGEVFSGTLGNVAFGNGNFDAGLTVSNAALSLSHSLTQTGSNANTLTGATTLSNTLTVGVDDTGYDVKFFGATSGAYMLWDESTNSLTLANGSNTVSLKAPSSVTSSYTLTLPTADGTNGQALKTNGSGSLSFGDVVTFSGNTVNGLTTFTDNLTATVESKLLFDPTTSPKLTIGDGSAEDTLLVFNGNAQDYRIGLDDGTDKLEFGVGDAHGTTTALTIDSNQQVNVTATTTSTSSTSGALIVGGGVGIAENTNIGGTLDVTGDTSVTTFDSSGATSLATGGGVVNIASTGVMTTVKGTLNVDEAVTFDNNLDITGDTTLKGSLTITNHDSGTGLVLGSTLVTSTAAELNLVDGSAPGTIVNNKAVIYANDGTISSSGQTITSDIRLKTNINTLENSLEKVLNLRGVNFNWIDTKKYTDKKQIGFIAQEVEEIAPELVNEKDDFKAVNYSQTVSLLVEAIKEQNNIINDLIDEVNYIKNNYSKKRTTTKNKK